MRRADGELIWVAHSTSAVLDARTSTRVTYRISLRDITERKRLETELSWQALHDPLTGLGNRIHLQRRLADAAADAGWVAAWPCCSSTSTSSRRSTTRSATRTATRCCASSRPA